MIVVAPAAPSDLDAAAAVLADAFVDDPVTAVVVGGDPATRLARTHHFFVGLLRPVVAAGTVDVARHAGDPDVLGVAIWEAPGARSGFGELVQQLPSFWRACGPGGLGRALATKRALERHRPRRAHWYLQEIGVGAAARGQGVGGALLGSRLAAVDEQGAAAYLESSTERNRALYRRHGFVDLAPVRGVDAAPMAMWRAPVSQRATRPAPVPA